MHYDARFFGGELGYGARRRAVRRAVRAYLLWAARTRIRVEEEEGMDGVDGGGMATSTSTSTGQDTEHGHEHGHEETVETWLAHGTLLGWWWNGRTLPWDGDADAQVRLATLEGVVRGGHNGSVYAYWDEDEDEDEDDDNTTTTITTTTAHNNPRQPQRYLLDVNPHYRQRGWARGQNVIDARWIDVATGVFVDITALSTDQGHQDQDQDQPGGEVWRCKNMHGYWTTDLYPLRETEFEGVPAWVPREYEEILVEEYGERSLTETEWAG